MIAVKNYRWLTVAVVVVAVLAVIYLMANPGGVATPLRSGERVVVIYLQGNIDDGSGGFAISGGITPRYVEEQLEKAESNPAIKAAVVRVNSPGGSVAASQQIAAPLKILKPLVISMGIWPLRGLLYLCPSRWDRRPARHPDRLYRGDLRLSIRGLTKLGLKVETIKSGRHKDMLSREMTAAERELMQALSDELYDQFVSDVARGRDLDKKKVLKLATGQVYTGTQALEAGLIDRLGGIEEAVAWAGEMAGLEDPEIYEFPPPSFLDQITGLGAKVAVLADKLTTPPEIQIMNYLQQYNYLPRFILE